MITDHLEESVMLFDLSSALFAETVLVIEAVVVAVALCVAAWVVIRRL